MRGFRFFRALPAAAAPVFAGAAGRPLGGRGEWGSNRHTLYPRARHWLQCPAEMTGVARSDQHLLRPRRHIRRGQQTAVENEEGCKQPRVGWSLIEITFAF